MLAERLLAIYPDIDFLAAVKLQDDGAGQYIKEWNDPRPQPSASEINAAELPAAKAVKISELEKSCESHVSSGFVSSALGTPHTYSSTSQDQTNILGARVAGIDMMFTCTDTNLAKRQRLHTAAQMAQVYVDGMMFLQTAYAVLDAKITEVNQAQSVEVVQGIVW